VPIRLLSLHAIHVLCSYICLFRHNASRPPVYFFLQISTIPCSWPVLILLIAARDTHARTQARTKERINYNSLSKTHLMKPGSDKSTREPMVKIHRQRNSTLKAMNVLCLFVCFPGVTTQRGCIFTAQ